MKNFSEKLKDIFYASIDYVIMIAIIATVVLIIGWRLDILFQKDVLASMSTEDISIIKEIDKKKDLQAKIEAEVDTKKDTDEDPEEADNGQIEKKEDPEIIGELKENAKIIEIKVPEGSFPAQIGSILQSSGLIDNSTDFIKKAVDMNLDTKLKSGTFSIPDDSSLEKIVTIIAKQRS